jgi:hypothetical protein
MNYWCSVACACVPQTKFLLIDITTLELFFFFCFVFPSSNYSLFPIQIIIGAQYQFNGIGLDLLHSKYNGKHLF